ncbi:hypothetical protein OH687_06115 [Burkholderia anthina]|nr:hypothetical protein OH687_06115 [Burkholderia anthina]
MVHPCTSLLRRAKSNFPARVWKLDEFESCGIHEQRPGSCMKTVRNGRRPAAAFASNWFKQTSRTIAMAGCGTFDRNPTRIAPNARAPNRRLHPARVGLQA